MPVKITTESAADLSTALREEFKIGVIPMNIISDGEVYKDGVTLFSKEMLKKRMPATTSAVNIEQYRRFFSLVRADGGDVIHISLSSRLSSTYSNACVAAKDFDNVYVLDSRNLSGGTGLLCVIASQLAESGMKAEKIAEIVEKKREFICTSFIIEDIDRLRKGGRCSSVEAFGASILGIKPSMEISDGKIVQAKKYRGKNSAVREKYLEKRANEITDKSVCFFNHTIENEEEVGKLKALLENKYGFEKVFVNRAGCCISAHCGAECCGVIGIV